MREGLIISAVGRDRPGIVDRISGAVFQLECNIEDSRMAILGGEFALVALIRGSADRLEQARRVLGDLCGELELTAQFKATQIGLTRGDSPGMIPYRLTAVALDQKGIVHRITHLLAAEGVNVAALETRLTYAPLSGTPIFRLEIDAQIPTGLPVQPLRRALQELADRENLDVELHARG